MLLCICVRLGDCCWKDVPVWQCPAAIMYSVADQEDTRMPIFITPSLVTLPGM